MTLEDRRRRSLRLDGAPALRTAADARRFLESVGFALRYAAPDGSVASFPAAVGGAAPDDAAKRRALDVVNDLLAGGDGIESSLLTDRLAIVHRSLMPAVVALVRPGGALDEDGLSQAARDALHVLQAAGAASAGDVRKALGLERGVRDDPAYAALAELQRRALVDRGPFRVVERGIAYMPKEGFPWRFLDAAHPDVVSAAATLDRSQALAALVQRYLEGAVFAAPRRIASIFRHLASRAELDACLDGLVETGAARRERIGREVAVTTA